MNPPIVSSEAPIALIGGGTLWTNDLEEALALSSHLVAADGGVSKAVTAGHVPDAVIGDFDSLPADARARVPADRFHHIAEQDSTDFDKALRSECAPVVIAVGFTGARVDHQLACLHILAARAAQPCILLGELEVICLLPRHLHLPTTAGETVSLFPLAQVQGVSQGLEWPIDGLVFDPLRQIGTSNRATGPVEITMQAPHMIGFFPRRHLSALTRALAGLSADARWPAL
ncbi:MAG: thiamine diphosphokinase [Rhodobacteraceae bacterium]|nr:thiamine diphosphokinase [Paracoccaceae bacterium]